MRYSLAPLSPAAVNWRERRSVARHALASLTPLALAALCSICPGHVLCSASVVLLVVLAAPQARALRHVRADLRPVAKDELTLLVVGELLARQHRVSILLDHIAMRLIQQTGALLFSVSYNA
jgi:hypothetical protein